MSIYNNDYFPIGIDPHKDECAVCFLHPARHVLKSFRIKNCSLPDANQLVNQAQNLAESLNLKPVFVFEATNVFWRPLFSFLKRKGFHAETVSSIQTKNARGTKMRKTKTDLIDAKFIAELFLQEKSHQTKFPEEPLMSIRELSRISKFLIDIKAKLLNRIYGFLFQIFPEFFNVISDASSNTALTLMESEAVHPFRLAKIRIDKLTNLIRKASHGKFSRNKAFQLKELAKSSFGIPEGATGFSRCLSLLASLYRFIDDLLNSLETTAILPLLNQVPQKIINLKGMSIISTASFVSELGNPNDFSNSDDALAWFGFDPSLSQSAKRSGQGKRISKCGTKYGRETMFLAAKSCMLNNPIMLAMYKKLRKNGCKDKEAKTILAAKLTKVFYAMYRDFSDFDPSKF